jgi:hypothetical protein
MLHPVRFAVTVPLLTVVLVLAPQPRPAAGQVTEHPGGKEPLLDATLDALEPPVKFLKDPAAAAPAKTPEQTPPKLA